jgi:hypothetical protein
MKFRMSLGQIKFYIERLQNYGTKFHFLVTILIAINVGVAAWYWWLLLIPIGIVTVILDRKYVAADDLREYMRINPAWIEMTERLERIEKVLKEKNEQSKR